MTIDLPTAENPVTIICGDSLEVLPHLPAGCIDAVLFDPPYGFAYRPNHGASWKGNEIEGDADTATRDCIIEWSESGNLPWACFGSWKRPRPEPTRAVLIWDKGPAFGMGDLSFPWKPSFDEIYIGGKGWQGKRDEGVLRGHLMVSWESKGREHQNQKPVSIMQALIEKLPSASIILDPTGGSGTTAVAAILEGKKCIVIEKSEAYCQIIKRRVDAAMGDAKGSLFHTPAPADLFAESQKLLFLEAE